MCYNILQQLTNSQLPRDAQFQALVRHIKTLLHSPKGFIHPKCQALKELLLRHFRNHNDSHTTVKVMVFASFRETVDEIVSHLNLDNQGIYACDVLASQVSHPPSSFLSSYFLTYSFSNSSLCGNRIHHNSIR